MTSVPLAGVTVDEIDALMGRVLDAADGSFNHLLELGFAGSIRREWAWRTSRGESLDNLAAFRHLIGELPVTPVDAPHIDDAQ
jgi:hypothetical protein